MEVFHDAISAAEPHTILVSCDHARWANHGGLFIFTFLARIEPIDQANDADQEVILGLARAMSYLMNYRNATNSIDEIMQMRPSFMQVTHLSPPRAWVFKRHVRSNQWVDVHEHL